MNKDNTLTYASYLQLDKILDLQNPKSLTEHDEMLFIVIHQVYELWFKQFSHEGLYLVEAFNQQNKSQIRATLKRLREILKILVSQVDILETMTPLSFSKFRDHLQSSSGFQSVQFRLVERLLGKKSSKSMEHVESLNAKENNPFIEKLTQRISNSETIYEAFLNFLKKEGHNINPNVEYNEQGLPLENTNNQKTLLEIYRNDHSSVQIAEIMVDIDEGLQEWRYRHVKMVERTIGVKFGTGGSPGVEYLKTTLFSPIFKDLWTIRNQF